MRELRIKIRLSTRKHIKLGFNNFKIDRVVCTGSDSVEHLKLFYINRHFHPATHLRLSLLVAATRYPPQLVLI